MPSATLSFKRSRYDACRVPYELRLSPWSILQSHSIFRFRSSPRCPVFIDNPLIIICMHEIILKVQIVPNCPCIQNLRTVPPHPTDLSAEGSLFVASISIEVRKEDDIVHENQPVCSGGFCSFLAYDDIGVNRNPSTSGCCCSSWTTTPRTYSNSATGT